jgi:NADH-quinone oxidoreductase subunit H
MPEPAATGQGLLATWLFFIALFVAILVALILVTWDERKILGRLQNRRGPTRTGPAGILQSLADGLKHLAKEDVVPPTADRRIFLFAPLLAFTTAFAALAVIPFGLGALTLPLAGKAINRFIADVNIGVLFILATSGLGVYGVILGGYASGNRYALLGGLRPAAQVISYEIVLGMSLLGPFLLTGTLSLRGIAAWQRDHPGSSCCNCPPP